MKLILAMAMLSFAIASQAQEVKPSSKFGMELQQHLAQNVKRTKVVTRSAAPETQKVKVLVSLVPTSGVTAADLEAVGCEVKFAMKSVASVIVPVDKLEALAAIEGVRHVNLPRKAKLLNDKARSVVFVDDAADPKKAVAAGLPHEYDGTGVLVGIIDVGIDFRNIAFTDKDGKTRIQRAYTRELNEDYTKSFVAHETPEEILKAIPTIEDSHGSHVLGIMTGRELGNNRHGMAPNAGIVAADCDVVEDHMIECMKNICEYAASVNKPVVINMSIGANGGLPDECDPVSEAMMELTDNGTKPGVIFAVAAGNEGDYHNFVRHKFTSDDEKIYVICDTAGVKTEEVEGHTVRTIYNPTLIYAWTDHLVDNKEEVLAVFDLEKKTVVDPDTEIGYAKVFTDSIDGEKKYHFFNTQIHFKIEKIPVTLRKVRDMLKEAEWIRTKIHTCIDGVTKKNESIIEILEGRVQLFENLRIGACYSYPAGTEILVANFSTNEKHRRFIKPEGFDCAKESESNGTINLYACNVANVTTGNYCTKYKITNYFDKEIAYDEKELNDVVEKSSYGVVFNEQRLPKPDVLAPGRFIESTTNNYCNNYFTEYGVLRTNFKDAEKEVKRISSKITHDNQDYWYEYQSGTSMASPVTAGVIALWLQANPNLSVADIYKVLENSCTPFKSTNFADEVKGSRYGLINALEGLKYINAHMTGISNIAQDSQKNADSRIFTLDGREVKGKPSSGIYVQNGKKFVIK